MERFGRWARIALGSGLTLGLLATAAWQPSERVHADAPGAEAATPTQAQVGALAPPVRARPLENDREVALSDYRGRVVLLAFVATWCGACRRMAPTLDALRREHEAEGLTVLALSHESRGRLRSHVSRMEPSVPWLQCTGRTAVRYGADGLPTLVVIDRAGQVRDILQGATGSVTARLRRSVEAALGSGVP